MMTNYKKGRSERAARCQPIRLLGLAVTAACLLLFAMLPFAYAAEETTLTLQLNEAKEKHQFIVEGDHPDFEVDLIMPDGTVLAHDDLDPMQQLYMGLDNQRIWVLMEAPAGQYTFRIRSETADGAYRVRTKDAIEMPQVVWLAPADAEITISSSADTIPLTWQAGGDIPSSARISFYLQRQDTIAKRQIGQTSVNAGSAELRIPSSVKDGPYILTVEADNGTFEAQMIDPAVTVIVDRGTEPMTPGLVGQFVDNGAWTVDLRLPNYGWDQLQAELASDAVPEPVVLTIERDELIEMETDAGERFSRWYITELTEDGRYSGQIYIVDQQLAAGPGVTLSQIEYRYIDAADHHVQWSIEEDRTNLRYMDVTVTPGVGSEIVLRSEHGAESRHEAAADDPLTLQIPLSEGETLYELDIRDQYGNVHTYGKRIIVDHTPPILEMIQPLPAHRDVPDSRVSGFVEAGSTLEIDGRAVEVAEDGYFQIAGVRSGFTLTAVDASGNVTSYHWAPEGGGGFAVWPFVVILGLAAVTGGIIWWLRRTSVRG